MKNSELTQKDKKELEKMINEKKEKLRQMRFNLVSGKVKNIREIREVKKDIAKMLTKINENDK